MNMPYQYGFGYSDGIGQTETIFPTAGGQAGFGFTGAVINSNPYYTSLVTQIGSAPGCALGNCCGGSYGNCCGGSYGGWQGGFDCEFNTLGSIAVIPNNRIAALVRNTVGGYW